MKNYLLGETGNFYKANMHCHTVVSDGKFTPEQIKQEYMKKGYSVVAFSDHNIHVNHQDLNDEKFLSLTSLEVAIKKNTNVVSRYAQKVYHFNLIDKNPSINKDVYLPSVEYDDIDAVNNYINDMNEAGFLVSYNHPYWSMQDYTDYKNLKNCFAMEIYNYGCELDGLYGYAPQVYDEMLREGHKLFCMATDDNHNKHPLHSSLSDSFGGFIMIESEELSYGSIINSLMSGCFYSSMGPTINEMYIEDDSLFIETSPVEKIYVITQTRNCLMELAEVGKTITNARFKLTGSEGYIRVDCRDGHGRHALTNAYRLRDAL